MKKELAVPEFVRENARLHGAAGERWLKELPELVRAAEKAFCVTAGEAVSGGTSAYICRAAAAGGGACVLKILPPFSDFERESAALTLGAGRGYAGLYAGDAATRALLLEPLGVPLKGADIPYEIKLDAVCGLLKAARRSPDGGGGCFKTPTDGAAARSDGGGELFKALEDESAAAARLDSLIFSEYTRQGAPCSLKAYRAARRRAEELAAAFNKARAALSHGDPHFGNIVLRGAIPDGADTESGLLRAELRLIDPAGLFAGAAFDAGVLLRDNPAAYAQAPPRLLRQRCLRICAGTGADAGAVWAWGQVQLLSTGLVLLKAGGRLKPLTGAARAYLNAAEHAAEEL